MLLLSATEKGENRSRETANRTSYGLYGTTNQGGSANYGTVYSITGNGVENVLHSFNGADGSKPFAGLVNVDDTLYGTTYYGGPSDDGTVYSVTTTGAATVLQ